MGDALDRLEVRLGRSVSVAGHFRHFGNKLVPVAPYVRRTSWPTKRNAWKEDTRIKCVKAYLKKKGVETIFYPQGDTDYVGGFYDPGNTFNRNDPPLVGVDVGRYSPPDKVLSTLLHEAAHHLQEKNDEDAPKIARLRAIWEGRAWNIGFDTIAKELGIKLTDAMFEDLEEGWGSYLDNGAKSAGKKWSELDTDRLRRLYERKRYPKGDPYVS